MQEPAIPVLLPDLVAELYNTRKQKAALDKTEKLILAQLKPQVDPQFDVQGDLGLPVSETVIHFGKLELSRSPGVTRTISAEKLLERGVSAEIVQYATNTTTYYKYLVKEAK